jgi:hypothetical protein
MMANRHRSVWIWVAVAAMAAVTLARAESGAPLAKIPANPVLAFLSNHSIARDFPTAGIPGMLGRATEHRSRLVSNGNCVWSAILPVLFIGLVAPLNQISPRAMLSLGRSFAAPSLPFLFQRPPPSFCV